MSMSETKNPRRALRTQGAVTLLLVAAGALLLMGLLYGFGSVSDCGSPWSPKEESLGTEISASLGGGGDDYYVRCQHAFGSQGELGGVLVGLAGLSALMAVGLVQVERLLLPQPLRSAAELTSEAPSESTL